MKWKPLVQSQYPDANCRFYFRGDGCWYVWTDLHPVGILGIGLSPAAAWRDAWGHLQGAEG